MQPQDQMPPPKKKILGAPVILIVTSVHLLHKL